MSDVQFFDNNEIDIYTDELEKILNIYEKRNGVEYQFSDCTGSQLVDILREHTKKRWSLKNGRHICDLILSYYYQVNGSQS